MQNLISFEVKTMSSREVAELTGKRHDNVKRTIESMAHAGVISQPQIEDGEKSANGVIEKIYLVNKRSSLIVVAQLCPEFTARIVDRWQELESQQPKLPVTYLEALRDLVAATEQVILLENKAKDDAPKVEFAIAVRRMEGACKIGDFGKVISIGRNILFSKLRHDRVLMADNMPYQKYIDAGYFVVIEQLPYVDHAGKAHPAFTTMVTGKGQVWLERKYRQAEAA
jgi:phage antirepressor YoqD-like protein